MSAYWPEFGAAGKDGVLVRELASHRAGLPAFEEPVTKADLADWDGCVRRLARQEPACFPGIRHGYHALTLGYPVGEVARRASGRSIGALLRERFAPDGDLQAWIGLPTEHNGRVVRYQDASPTPGIGAFLATAAETPGTDRVRHQQVHGPDEVLVDQPTRFGTVFGLSSPRQPMLGHGSSGHDGLGGHLAFAHPESGIAFAFLTNRAIPDPTPHTRLWGLLSAVAAAL